VAATINSNKHLVKSRFASEPTPTGVTQPETSTDSKRFNNINVIIAGQGQGGLQRGQIGGNYIIIQPQSSKSHTILQNASYPIIEVGILCPSSHPECSVSTAASFAD